MYIKQNNNTYDGDSNDGKVHLQSTLNGVSTKNTDFN